MFKHSVCAAICILILSLAVSAQAPGGRGGIPNATPGQTAAIAQMNAGLAPWVQSLAAARTAVTAAALADPRNDAAIQSKVDAVKAAELALASARADAVAKIQASPDKLSTEQLAALASQAASGRGGGRGAAAAGRGGAGGTGGRGGAPGPATTSTGTSGGSTSMPHVTADQASTLLQMTSGLTQLTQALTAARTAVTVAALADPRNDAAVKLKVEAVGAAELTLATARADALAKIQATPNKLDAQQLAWLVAAGGGFGTGGFTEPEPYDFNDHRGYVPLFDGVSLKGWDGNPKFWRAEDGAIVGESTPQNPSGNTYIVYRDVVAKDFTLKFEMKIEGDGGSGMQYRSKSGIPWSRPIAANVTANVGPLNLNWMLTGPQADFWPSRIYTGQFYSENTPMGIMAWRGQVVEGAGLGAKRLMGTIGDRVELGKLVKMNDWNQYIVIARGGTFIHIVNGQVMAVMVDDDPNSSNNQPGMFGIEIEATTKVSVRNIWLKKLD